jgi:ribose/xylose/arabinose/galactoside ABC-type transport system permease subunit
VIFKRVLSRYDLIAEMLLLIVIMAILEPTFLSTANLINILRQYSPIGIMAVGMTFVILTGGIDLSVGSLLALTGVICAYLEHQNLPLAVVILATLALGAGLGAVNGVVVTVGRVTPFVVTLGMMSIARGWAHIFTKGEPISRFGAEFSYLGKGSVWEIPVPVVLFGAVVLLAAVVLEHTVLGRYLYAIGGNEEAARLSGVRVRTCKTIAYAVCGLTAALGGIVLTARLGAAESIAGTGYELDVIAAVVIGGTSLMGGRGSVWGTLFGALLIGAINNGMVLLNISSYYQLVVKGTIIILAVMADRMRDR